MTETQYEKVSVSDIEKETTEAPSHYGFGIRHLQCFLFFLSLALGYIARGHIGVTIVAMTDVSTKENSTKVYNLKNIILETNGSETTNKNKKDYDEDLENFLNETESNNTILFLGHYNGETKLDTNSKTVNKRNIHNEDIGTSTWNIYRIYNWPKSTQEMVQGAFFLGYFVMMFPTGLVVQRWGGKLPLQISLFINGITSLAVPWLTAWGGWKVLCACRLVQGLTQAGLYPSIHNLLANWVPISERGTLSSYVYTGSGFGTIVAFQLGGVLADSPWGWPSTFMITGLMCLLGFLFVTIFGANKPTEHKSVSEKEKNYILGHFEDEKKKIAKTPWKKIATSRHTWACFSGHIGSGVTFVFFFTQFPTYMHAILDFNIKSSGLLSSLPYIFTFLSTIMFGHLSDFCTNRKILSIRNARKISNSIGGVGTAVCLAAVAFIHNPILVVILFTLTLSFHSAGHTGWMVNYIDLAPNYSGAMMAFGNTLCNSLVLMLPIAVSNIVTNVKNSYQWRIVFLLMASLAFLANFFYVLFMSVDITSWNEGDENNEPEQVKLEEHPEKN